jgi:Tfp pilus assembly protein PilN
MRAVNLLPMEQRTGQSVGIGRSQGGAYAVLVLVGGIALMAFLYGEAKHQVGSRRAQVASLNEQAQQAQAAAERLAPYTSFIALRNQRMQAVETLIDSRFDWAHVMHEFGRVLPSQASISSLSGTIGAAGSSVSVAPAATTASTPLAGAGSSAAAASVTPPGSVPTFTLTGCATSQSTVALTLERLRLIDGVKEVTLQSSTAGTASSGGGAALAGSCSGHDASFSATVSFDPLPSATAAASAAKSVSDQTGASAGTSAAPTTSTGSGVTAR